LNFVAVKTIEDEKEVICQIVYDFQIR